MMTTSESAKHRLMVSAYACEPWKGSEIGVGWHWVLELSREFELWVITRANNREPNERWNDDKPGYESIQWVNFDQSANALARKHGRKGVHRYYLKWTKASDAVIRETMRSNDIETFLHLTYGNVLWPVSRFGASRRFIWGPVGGLETIPREYSKYYSLKSRVMESVRRLAAKLVPLTPGFRRRCRNADLILCKTEITRSSLPKSCRSKAVLMTDVAADISDIATPQPVHKSDGALRLLCVGRLDAWRGFDIAIEAVARLRDTGMAVHLDILGKGPDKSRLKGIISSLALTDYATLRGEVPAEEYRRLLHEADIMLNTSLKEGAVTVSIDDMAARKPLVALDTTGYTRYFRPEYSVIIPRGRRDEVIAAVAAAVTRLGDDSCRQAMGNAALEAASEVSWEWHGREIRDVVRNIINADGN